MKLTALAVHAADVPLTRPYAVASHATDAAALLLLRVDTDAGRCGLGAATPEPTVNGDTRAGAVAALAQVEPQLLGRQFARPEDLLPQLRAIASPAARAALDMALFDLCAKAEGRPLVDLLGRVHEALPTSVTLGIRDVDATLAEAREYVGRGFTVLKVKIGRDLDRDVDCLQQLRQRLGPGVALRADGNVGYAPKQLLELLRRTRGLELQFVEQPLPPAQVDAQRLLPPALVERLMADESLHDAGDARQLAAAPRPFGQFNVKLMKCGGILEARAIAAVAHGADIGLMWGCMDESRIGIAAALHAALACAATRWLDLDGHLDLAHDFASGGFELQHGVLRPLQRPGLGVDATRAW